MKKFILFSLAIALGGSNTLFAAQGVAGKILRKRLRSRTIADEQEVGKRSRSETIADNISSKYAFIDEVISADHVCIEYYRAQNTPVIKYHLPVKVAKLSRFFKETLDVQEEAQEEELQIVIPNVMSHTTLELLIDLMNIYNQIEERNPESSDHGKIRFLYTSLEAQSLSEETLEELLEALYFLGVPPLINTIHLLFHVSSHNFSGAISSRIIPQIKECLQHAADKSYDEIKQTKLVDLSVIPESFKDINDLKSYLNHPIAQSFRHHSNKVMAKFVRECMMNEQMVSFVRDYIAQASAASTLQGVPELINTFQAQPESPLYIALFIEYYLQTNAQGTIAAQIPHALMLSEVANRICSFRANPVDDAILNFSYIGSNEFSSILGFLCQIIEPLCQRPLTKLYLSGNQLTSFPAELGSLTKLTYLNISLNQLTEVPAALGNLINLTTLNLSQNQLTEVPEGLGNLTNLKILILYYNQLTSLPASLNRVELILVKDNHVVFTTAE